MDGRYTVGLRDLVVFAGADGAFAKAEARLKKFCGISISENTIKMLCDQEADKMEKWRKTDPVSTQKFRESYGELEFTTDGTMGDGAHWIWDACQLEFGKTLENLDIFHGLENLSKCGKTLFAAESPELAAWQTETKRLLLEEGYVGIHAFLEQQKKTVPDDKTKLKALETVEGYLTWHKTRLGYRERLWEGRAIGSGQVEGACKNLIGTRLKQTGARWREDRVNRMGVICSLFYTEQWDEYWKLAS